MTAKPALQFVETRPRREWVATLGERRFRIERIEAFWFAAYVDDIDSAGCHPIAEADRRTRAECIDWFDRYIHAVVA